MKKIKFLLLGIVSILGIGLSSATPVYHTCSYGSDYPVIPNGITEIDLGTSCVIGTPWDDGNYSFGYSAGNILPKFSWQGYLDTNQTPIYSFCGKVYFSNESSTRTGFSFLQCSGILDNVSFLSSFSQADGTGVLYVPRSSTGFFHVGSTDCVYFPNKGQTQVRYCGADSTFSDCSIDLNGVALLICGDTFHYKSTVSNRDRTLSYYYLTGLYSNGTNSDPSDPFTSPIYGGVFDFNSFLIEKSILCYMSSGTFGGEYGDCSGINYTGFVDQYEHVSPIWSGNSESGFVGNIVFNNAEPVLTNYCLNTDSIQYQFCSQLNVYSGAYLMYYYENGLLSYYVLGDGFGVDLGNLGSGQLGELTCQGAWCNGNINEGLPEYINTITGGENNEVFSGKLLDSGYFIDLLADNLFFSCPFDYSGSSFTIGNKLINALGGRDILKPINCFIAGFLEGHDSSFFGNIDNYIGSGTLFKDTSPNAKRLYLFFDLILSLLIIIGFSKIFNLFNHK